VRRGGGRVAVSTALVVHENVMTALVDAEFVRTTEALDAGTRRGQSQTLEAERRRFSAANGMLSRPVGTPPFAWLVGHRPCFDLDVLAPQDRELQLQLSNGTNGPQRVTVVFNGQAIGDHEFPPGAELATLTLPVPAELQWRGRNRVELVFDRVEMAQKYGEPVALPIAGVLTHVAFRPPGAAGDPPPAPATGLVTEGAGSSARAVLLLSAGSSARVPLQLPAAPRVALRFTPLELGLSLELSLVTDSGRRTLLRTFQPGEPALSEARFDLTPWAGQAVVLETWARDDAPSGAGDRRVRLGGMQILVPASWRELDEASRALAPAAQAAADAATMTGEGGSPGAADGPAGGPGAAAAGGRPSFLVITLDALARRWVSAQHRGSSTTPNLDALLARGIAFPQATALSCYTLASVATLLTGQDPLHHGVALLADVNGAPQQLDAGAPRLASLLHDRGWRTAAFMTNPNTAKEHGFAAGFDSYAELFRDESLFREGVAGENLPPRLDDFLRASAGAPFLAWVHVFEPHAPYDAPEELKSRFVAPYDGPVAGTREWINGYRNREVSVDAAGWQHLRDLYAARVALADRVLGELLATLERSGRAQDTVVVVLSDHGESLGEHGALEHGDELWSEQIDVPLVFAVPGRGGARRPGPATLADVAPTVLALAGVPAPRSMDGTDLLAGALDPERGHVARSAAIVPVLSWTRGRWRLVLDLSTRRRALYDLEHDPAESRDLSDEHPATAALCLRELCAAVCAAEARGAHDAGHAGPAGDAGTPGAAAQPGASGDAAEQEAERERREQLRQIGYVGRPAPANLVTDHSSLGGQIRALLMRL